VIAFEDELTIAITAIEFAFDKGWYCLWLGCYSSLLVKTFKNFSVYFLKNEK